MKLSLKLKLVLLFSISFIIGTVGIGVYTVSTVKQETLESARVKLLSDLELGKTLLDERYPGEWSIKDGKMYKGDVLMNENFDTVDEIGEKTGDTVTIFQGDTRISTNVKLENGERAVGTTVSDVVAQTTLEQGQRYIGKANVVGTWNQTAYEPIKNAQGDIIGIWYVGIPNTPYDKMADNVKNKVFLFIIIELLIFTIIFWYIISRGTKKLEELNRITTQVANGDLTTSISETKSNDEIGNLTNSVNHMIENLRNILKEVTGASTHVSSSAQELNASAEQSTRVAEQMAEQAQRSASDANEQLQSVNNVSASIQQMASGIKEIASSSDVMKDATEDAMNYTNKGSQSITNLVQQMNEIQSSVADTTSVVGKLEKHTDHIEGILTLITDLAEQTNLLSLNAAIEAARAGEHGKGFAVVADEVRKLADQSKSATGNIAEIVSAIQIEVKTAVQSMEAGNEKVRSGIQFSDEVKKAFTDIEGSNTNVSDKVQTVSSAIEQMREVSSEIVRAVERVNEIAEHNMTSNQDSTAATEEQLATMEEVTSSAESLTSLADNLQDMISKFKVSK